MPIYEYECNDCGEAFEKMVPFSQAEAEQACPACKSQNTKKKLSTFAAFGGPSAGGGGSMDSSCGSSGGFT